MKNHRRDSDPCPNLFFSEEDGFRYLHFGSPWIQGAMRVGRPYDLVLEYPRQMMACALFYPEPEQIVQLGLGAASLTKFCWKHTSGLSIHLADAKEFIGARSDFNPPQWLQVDIYDEDAKGPVYDDVEFYKLCRRAMDKKGSVASFNLFGSRFEKSFRAIDEAFEHRTLVMPEIDEGNRVVLAFAGKALEVTMEELYERAHRLSAAWRLGAVRWVHGLKAKNSVFKETTIRL